MNNSEISAKPSLSFQILLVFVVIILVGNLTVVGLVNLFMTANFRAIAYDNGLQQAQMLSYLLGDFYTRNKQSWFGVKSFLDNLTTPGRMMRHHMPMQRENPPPGQGFEQRMEFILTDEEGRILFDSVGSGTKLLDPAKKGGVPVQSGLEIAGYVYTAPMIFPHIPRRELAFLSSLNLTVLLIALCTAVLFICVGFFIIRRFLTPVRLTAAAARKIADGDYSVRVPAGARGETAFLATQFNTMAEALEKSVAWKKRLIRDTAHELRTPVSLIAAKIEMIRDGIYTPNPARLDELYGRVTQLSTLIEEMEELSALESETLNLSKEQFPLSVLFDGLKKEFEAVSAKKNISLCVDTTMNIEILADFRKMEQVFRNLLANAFDFCPEGGKIELNAMADKNQVKMEVRDTGEGVPPGEDELIFTRFYRIEKSRSRDYGGKGLGLAITRAIVNAHGGRIFLDRSYKKGACFTVVLPREKPAEAST
jgi:two-component system sensor histidine kinase BaeS